jgi:hypothetical protein
VIDDGLVPIRDVNLRTDLVDQSSEDFRKNF